MDERRQREVADGLRDGKPEAWRALYEAYAERVWRCVTRLVGANSSDVADVVQETFLAAANSARGFDPDRGSLWSWLWGIAHRHVALLYRKRAKFAGRKSTEASLAENNGQKGFAHGPDNKASALALLSSRELDPVEALQQTELVDLVRATLVELPAAYASLLTAKYLDGESLQAIAETENATVDAVSSKLGRARRAFREKFEKHLSLVASQ